MKRLTLTTLSVCLLAASGLWGQIPFGSPELTHLLGHDSVAITAGDWNHDGFVDLATCGNGAVSVLRNDGTGVFTTVTQTGIPSVDIEDADMDGDGNLDLVVLDRSGRRVLIFLGDGLGGFPLSSPLVTDFSTLFTTPPDGLVVKDLDGDGDPDVGIGSWSGVSGFLRYENVGGSNILSFIEQGTLGPFGGYEIDFLDLDGDGDHDIVQALSSGFRWYENHGGGVYGAAQDVNGGCGGTLASGDFDGNGRVDLAIGWRGYSSGCLGDLTVYLNQGQGNFNVTLHEVNQWVTAVVPADLDDDGDLDLVVARNDGLCRYLLNDGAGCFLATPCSAPGVQQGAFDIAQSLEADSACVADVDNDGKADLVFSLTNHPHWNDLALQRNLVPLSFTYPGTSDGLQLFSGSSAPGSAIPFTTGTAFESKEIASGDSLGLRIRSLTGSLDGAPIVLAATFQGTGSPLANFGVAGFQLDITNWTILFDALTSSPFQFPIVLPGGTDLVLGVPLGLTGVTAFVQAFAVPALALPVPLAPPANGLFASSEVHELRFL